MSASRNWALCPLLRDDYRVSDMGEVKRIRPGRPDLELVRAFSRGYPRVRAVSADGVYRDFYVHVLVLTAFDRPRPSKIHEVAHHDGDRTNATLANLFWKTKRENAADRRRHGTQTSAKGEAHHNAKLTADKVIEIRALRFDRGWSYRQIAGSEGFGLHPSTVRAICLRKAWAHVS